MAEAAFRKYPNPYSSSIHSLDTVERTVSPAPGESVCTRLYSHRLFCTRWNVPAIVAKIIGNNLDVLVNEQSLCELNHNVLTIHARNISHSGLFSLDETLEYSQCPKDPTNGNEVLDLSEETYSVEPLIVDPLRTVLKQTAKMNVFGIPLLGSLLESIWLGQYESTVENGRKGIESVAEKVVEEQRNLDPS